MGGGSFPELGLHLVSDAVGPGQGETHALIEHALRIFFAPVLGSPGVAPSYRHAPVDHAGQLGAALQAANAAIFSRGRTSPPWRGAGASVAAIQCTNSQVEIAHAGDCRVYRLRNDRLEALTEDHCLLRDYLKTRSLSAHEIAHFPHKHVLTRALGLKDTVAIETRTVTAAAGDLYVLCTDGVHKPMSDEQIAEALRTPGAIAAKVHRLITRAQELGGFDNITALAVRM